MTAASTIKILNVEDNDGSRYATSRFLQRAGFTVLEAATGGDALRVVVEENPHLVLLDVHLPDIHGMEVCRRIKADPVTSSIPVLHLSATSVDSRARVQGLESGADGYLTEPVDPEVLIATVRALLRTQQRKEVLRADAQHWQTIFTTTSDGVALLDQEGRVVRCNQALGTLLRLSASQCIGCLYHELLPTGLQQATVSALHHLRETHRRETLAIVANGRWLRITADPVLDKAGVLTGVVSIMSDLTKHRRRHSHQKKKKE